MVGQETPGFQPKDNVAAEPTGPKAETGGISNGEAEKEKSTRSCRRKEWLYTTKQGFVSIFTFEQPTSQIQQTNLGLFKMYPELYIFIIDNEADVDLNHL